jgi:pimeloyl-ACP methyl ester carboxylesterase
MLIFASIVGGLVALIVLVLAGLALFTAWTARRVEKALPPQGRFLEVDGVRLHYVDQGTGPAILLVHGLGGQMGNFTHSLLARLTPNFRVIIIDRPGSGYSAPSASASLSAQAALIAKFVQKLGIERPLIVGHSLGGALALLLALRHPAQVGGLALIAAVTCLPGAVPRPFQGLEIASAFRRWLIAWTLATPVSIANRQLALDTIFGPQPVPTDFATKGAGYLSLRPKSFIGASRDLVASGEDLPAMPELYSTLTVPIGIIYGTDDRVLDQKTHCETLTSRVAGVDCELIDGGGHMILITSADRCATFIARMASRLHADAKPASIA